MRSICILLVLASSFPAQAETVSVSELFSDQRLDIEAQDVKLKDELDGLFSSLNCFFPETLARRLKRENAIIPGDLADAVGPTLLASTVKRVDDKNIRAVLHGAEYEVDGKATPFRLVSTGSVGSLQPLSMVDSNSSNFAYTLDCSGYLNVAVAATGGLSGNEMKAAARQALAVDKSLVVAKGSIFSPIAIALHPGAAATALSNVDQADILFALFQEVRMLLPTASDSTIVRAPRLITAIWTSNQGSSKLQGASSLSGQGGFNAGFVSVSGSAGAGVDIRKDISFANFNTYVIGKPEVAAPSTLGQIRDRAQQLVNSFSPSKVMQVDNRYVAEIDLPRNVCTLPWTVRHATGATTVGSARTASDGRVCRFEIRPNGALSTLANGFRLETTGAMGANSKFELRVVP